MEISDFKPLKNALDKTLKENILKFWINNTIDKENGGFISFIDSKNSPDTKANKGIILTSRILWTFSAVYGYEKNDTHLKLANRAYQYLVNYFKDNKHGGVYWELNCAGQPVNKRKQVYAQAFTIYSLAEYFKITKNEEVKEWAKDLFNLLETYSFDENRHGYIEAFAEDWGETEDVKLSDKEGNEKKTMNTHLHVLEAYTNLYRVWPDDRLYHALFKLIHVFIKYFINNNYRQILFFTEDWVPRDTIISYGHDMECSWLLYEAAEVIKNEELIEKTGDLAVKMAENVIKTGIDQSGGINYETDISKNHTDDDKHWWVQAEGLVGLMNAWQLSKNPVFKKKLFNLWKFIDSYIIDHENGEWFWKVDNRGIPDDKYEKVGPWKCPYHNARACMEVIRRINDVGISSG